MLLETIAGLVFLVALVAYLVSRQNTPHQSSPELSSGLQNSSDKLPSRTARNVGLHPETPQAPVFDADTARETHQKRVVEGVAYVTDGDTITINKTQIRLFGIDAPELDHPYGKKSKWAMVRLCKGHKVRAEITDVDAYGRTVAKCFLPDGRDLSAELVKQGLAIDWPKFSGGKYGHLEVAGVRKKLWLADARQKGKMYVWEKFEANRSSAGNLD